MKICLFAFLLTILNSALSGEAISDTSNTGKVVEIKLEKGLPELMRSEFGTQVSAFHFAIVPGIISNYKSIFILEKKEDGSISYWWVPDDKDKSNYNSIYLNDFSSKLISFLFESTYHDSSTIYTIDNKIELYKTEKIIVTQKVKSQKSFTHSKTSFYLSFAAECLAYISHYENNQRNMPPNTIKKKFWKLNTTDYSGSPIAAYSLGFNLSFSEINVIEFKLGFTPNKTYSGLDLGLFYNRFFQKNMLYFVGIQTHVGSHGSASYTSNYLGGGFGYTLNKSFAGIVSLYFVNADAFYGYENSNIAWRGLIKIGIKYNY